MTTQTDDAVERAPDLVAPAKSGTTLRGLLRRIKPGDIAVVNMPDMDAWPAEQLLAAGVAAVVNASESITGRSPTAAVSLLLDEGIAVLDNAGEEIVHELQQGETLTLSGSIAELRGGVRAQGLRLTPELASERLAMAREYLAVAMSKMADAVSNKASAEWTCFLGSARMPFIEYLLRGQMAAVVTDGPAAVAELRSLRLTLSRAVIIGAEKGCAALTRASIRPAIVVGHDANLTDNDLLAAIEVVLLHAPGEPPAGVERCERLGVRAHTLEWPGPAAEAALALAADTGARIVLQVGGTYSFTDLARRPEAAMSAAMLMRLRLGSRVIDASTLKRLHPGIEIPPLAYAGLGAAAVGLILLAARVLFG
jgi:uncharacterized membrane-anchored protein